MKLIYNTAKKNDAAKREKTLTTHEAHKSDKYAPITSRHCLSYIPMTHSVYIRKTLAVHTLVVVVAAGLKNKPRRKSRLHSTVHFNSVLMDRKNGFLFPLTTLLPLLPLLAFSSLFRAHTHAAHVASLSSAKDLRSRCLLAHNYT